MTIAQANELMNWIDENKISESDKFFMQTLRYNMNTNSMIPDALESQTLQEIYRRSVGGNDKQNQPFKAYQRPKSRGI